mgnify:CR=1 FL=1
MHKALEENADSFYALCDGCAMDHPEGLHHHDHLHFQCIRCQRVHCLPLQSPVDVQLPGVSIDSLEIMAKGICANCEGH